MIHNEFDWLAKLDWHPRTILDAGGNGGFTALLFSHIFPEATIVVLEVKQTRKTCDAANILPSSEASQLPAHCAATG